MSRSATIVIAYLLQYGHKKKWDIGKIETAKEEEKEEENEWSVVSALQYVRSIRPVVLPNKGFLTQLIRFEESLGKPSSERQLFDVYLQPSSKETSGKATTQKSFKCVLS